MSLKIFTYLLLILGLTLPALSQKCPDHDSLPATCECEDEFVDEVDVELSCVGSSMGELEDALRMMDKNSRLEVMLDDMKLGNLPSKIFDGLNVVKLDISHCDLDGLSSPGEAPLQGLEDKLEVLVITSSFTEENVKTKLPSLANFNRLNELDLSYNGITELSNDWFASPPPALQHLSLSNNGIEKLGERAFEKLLRLDKLDLHGNRFGPVKRSMFPGPGNQLKDLELDNNALTSLPDDIFSDMPRLTTLSIRTNGIAHLQESVFKPIWSLLHRFDARGNPLECDSSMEWLFHVHKEPSVILGRCDGPDGREDMELHEFIESKGN